MQSDNRPGASQPENATNGGAQTPPPHNPPPQGYGYGYGYGYGNGAYGVGDALSNFSETMQTRTVADYVMIFRERIWYLILSVFIVVTGVLVYTYNIVPEYTASGRMQVLRQSISVGSLDRNNSEIVGSQDDFMTQVEIMLSEQIIERVQARLTQAELSEVVDPYRDGNVFSGPLSPMEVIARHRAVQPKKATLIVTVSYTHRNREIAKKMTDYFIDEISKYNMEVRSLRANPVIDSTRIKIVQLEKKLEDERRERVGLIKREGLLTVEMGTVASELSQINATRDTEQKNYEDLLATYTEIQKTKSEGKSLLTQPAITNNSLVSTLLPRVSELRISINGMLEKYGKNHPSLIQATQQLEQAEKELTAAVKKSESEFASNFIAAKRRYEDAVRRAVEKKAQIERLREADMQRETLDEQIRNDSELLQRLKISLEDQNLKLTVTSTSIVQPLDSASSPNMPSNKNFLLNGIFGIVGGLAVGSGIVVLLSFLDDRIKSVKDVEQSLALPLLASVVKMSTKDSVAKACAVAQGHERGVVESFISLYSALKIGDISRTAKVLSVTSTTPSEGKTFISTNLAMTYANHGERVLIFDGDLRLPNVGRSLGLAEDQGGLVRYMNGEISLDEAICKDFIPNCDVLQVGSGCKNPTQIINSKKFADLVAELKTRYDRIVVDTPPAGVVSDILNILPLCDGVIYTVKFNAIQRAMVKNNLRRLEETHVPVFGVVMNQMLRHTARFYTYYGNNQAYSRYYGNSRDEGTR